MLFCSRYPVIRGVKNKRRWSTENRFLCFLAWWFYESHGPWPHRVLRVYGFKEYFTASSRHVWVEKIVFWRSLYRAVGMVFVWAKRLWDWGEAKLWEPKDKPEFTGGM